MKLTNRTLLFMGGIVLLLALVATSVCIVNYRVEKKQKKQEPQIISGIGVLLKQNGNDLLVEGVVNDSPASKAGILKGDKIDAIDNVCANALSGIDEVKAKITGNVGTPVALRIIRNNEVTNFNIIREKVSTVNGLVEPAEQKTAANYFHQLGNMGEVDKGVLLYKNEKVETIKTACSLYRLDVNESDKDLVFYLFDSVSKTEKPLLRFNINNSMGATYVGYYNKNLFFDVPSKKGSGQLLAISLINGQQKFYDLPNYDGILSALSVVAGHSSWLFPNGLIFYTTPDNSNLMQYNIDSGEEKVIVPEFRLGDSFNNYFDVKNGKLYFLTGFMEMGRGHLEKTTVNIINGDLKTENINVNYPECYVFNNAKCTAEEVKSIALNEKSVKEIATGFVANQPLSCAGISLAFTTNTVYFDQISKMNDQDIIDSRFVTCLQ